MTRPPYGYKRAENETARIVPDEEEAEFVREAFRQAARTSLPLEQIRKGLWKKGFKISRARFPDLLRNPVYAGKIHIEAWRKEPEQTVEGLHEALVSEALFYEVQLKRFEEEDPRSTKTKRLNGNLPLRGHLVCPDCLEADAPNLLTSSGSRGRSKRYWYYHCHHKRGREKCSHRFRADAAHEAIKDFLADLEIADEVKLSTKRSSRTWQIEKKRLSVASSKRLRVRSTSWRRSFSR